MMDILYVAGGAVAVACALIGMAVSAATPTHRGYQPTDPLKGCPPTPDGHYRDERCHLHKGAKP